MSYQVKDIDQEQWRAFLDTRPESNFLQAWQWGQAHVDTGHELVRLGIFDGDSMLAAIQGIVMNAKRGRYLEIGGGPLLDWNNTELVKYLMEALKNVAAAKSCVFVRIRPQLESSETSLKLFSDLGLRRAAMHLYAQNTSILDLAKSEEELLAAMRRQTRYEIRQAVKQNIVVESSSGEAMVNKFYELQQETARRHRFIGPSRNFLTSLVRNFCERAVIYTARKDGHLLALALIIFYGREADYYEGASTLEGRELAGSYGIQWQVIQDAKAAGCKRYNLWGIAPPGSNENHRFANVTTFKQGFGGEDYNFIPAHDLVINKIKYLKNLAVERIRRKIRKL